MSDYVPIAQTSARSRTGIIVAAILLAFLVGAILMGYAMKHVPWFGGTSAGTQQAAPRDPVNYTPAQPLGPNGAQPQADTAILASREAALAGQLSALEARTAAITVDAAAAGNQANRAEGLLIAFATRRALDRGLGLGYLEEQLRARFGATQPRAVSIVIETAKQPVTREDLRQGLDAIAPALASGGGSDGWLSGIARELGHLVVLRQASTPSPLPYDRLARARRLLEAGQVEAARDEVGRLPGADDAGNWMSAASRYVAARQSLDAIENAAILGQTAQSAAPAPDAATSPPATTAPVTTIGH